METLQISEQWTVQTSDCAAFLQYRGVDVIALWTPFDDPESTPNLTISNPKQYTEWEYEAEKNILADVPQTEWGQDETIIMLDKHTKEIDGAIDAIEQAARRESTLAHLRELGADPAGRTPDDVTKIVNEYLEAHT